MLTHSDFDHTDGARFLIDHFDVKEMWISQWRGGIHYEHILELSEMKNIPVYLISKETGAKIFKGVEFQFLNPKNIFEEATDNHQSIVFKCRYKNFSILFTGDIEKDVEEELSSSQKISGQKISGLLQSAVLKVPHHGSKTSSSLSFLRSVKPKFAVISSCYANRFGHPHDEALQRYRKLGIPLFRTDQGGTLEIRTDGEELHFF
jgi:competence protein ComEC